MVKLTIIGAGSTVFTKNIVTDLLTIKNFQSIEIALMDIDEQRLKSINVQKPLYKYFITENTHDLSFPIVYKNEHYVAYKIVE